MHGEGTSEILPGAILLRDNEEIALPGRRLPLWLSVGEAEALLALSCTSPLSGGAAEHDLFHRMGDLLRAFGPEAPRGIPLRWSRGRPG